MKFKNYKNPHTKDSRIYSDSDIYNMTLGNIFKNVKEILGQKRAIGIPSVNELKSSGNVVWISEYTRDDGTRVCGHWRSKPDGEGYVPLINESTEIKSSDLSSIKLKQNVKLSKLKVALINFNNNENINYKDAMRCMNMGLIGLENIEDNADFKILSKNEVLNLSKQMKFDIPNNVKTVQYSPESSFAEAVKNSSAFKKAIKSWIVAPTEYKSDKILLELNDNENLARSILHATIFNPQVSNGYITGYLYDLYDFRLQMLENFYKTRVNTGAVVLQRFKQLKNYNILIPIKIKL